MIKKPSNYDEINIIEEYDYLKFIEHEYTNLFDDVEDLINNTDDLKYHDMLKLDYEQLDAIIKRYFKEQYLQRIEEIEEENK